MKFTQKEKDIVKNLIKNEPSETSLLFFSNSNINELNKQIKNCIMNSTEEKYGKKILIEDQKKTSMFVIMRFVYLEYSKYNFILKQKPIDQVIELNNQFIKVALPIISQSLVSYIKYINDFNKMTESEPLDRPKTTRSIKEITKEPFYF